MAQRIETLLISDVSGEPAAETVEFGLDGKTYAIDLSADEAEALRESIAEYVHAARKAGSVKKPWAGERMSREEAQSIRSWARSCGMKVAERGRIPADVLEGYQAQRTVGFAA